LTRDHPAATTLVVIIVVVVVVIALLVVIVVIVLSLLTVIIFFFPLLISVKLHRSSSTRVDTYVLCTSSFSHVLQEKYKISMHANYHSR
jgi:hypothetical protein